MRKKVFFLFIFLSTISISFCWSQHDQDYNIDNNDDQLLEELFKEIENTPTPKPLDLGLDNKSTLLEDLKLFWNLPFSIKVELTKQISKDKAEIIKEHVDNHKYAYGVGTGAGLVGLSWLLYSLRN
jgi:hypothetical protein